jgi:hypothetical protein
LGRNYLKLFLDWNGEIIAGNIILFEAELPASAFPSGPLE